MTTMSGCRSVARRSASVASVAVNTPARPSSASASGVVRLAVAVDQQHRREVELGQRVGRGPGQLGGQVLLDVAGAAGGGELLREPRRRGLGGRRLARERAP